MKTIILVRHGQSETNVRKVFTGQLNAPLTEAGREQANRMAQYLDKYRIEKIYASSLDRAVETARAIADRQSCPIEKSNAIMEIYSGLWQGLTFAEIAEKYPQTYAVWRSDMGNAEPDGGETCKQIYQRVTAFLEKVLTEPEETVCLVCHAIPIRMIESYIHYGSVTGAQEISWVPNASVTAYTFDGQFREAERGVCDFLGDLCTNLPKNI